ncbi:MAG: NAD(P)-dependent oxidoreductase [Gammaproteobacteria bacterium]|nr:NAD(P)-dependent oxidoreductase [Gammaproteobacteria bacterium]
MSNSIWLSGSRGFVGAYVKKLLTDLDVSYKCLSNSKSQDENIIYVDFSNKQKIKEAVDQYGVPETFIHLGWGNVYEPHDESHLKENLEDGKNLIDQLYECGLKRFILIGSSSEYGDRTGLLKESFTSSGEVNNYVKGKVALSKYGLNAAKNLSRIFIHARLFYTYGAGQQHNSLINQLFQSHLQNAEMNLSPCEHYRDYIHVSEAAEGLVNISNVKESSIINLGSGNVIKLKEFVEIFWDELGAEPNLLNFGSYDQPSSEQSQPRAYADLSTLENLTGWKPEMSIRDGIRRTINDLRLSSYSQLDKEDE